MQQDLLTEHARELVKMPPEWSAYRFEAISNPSDQQKTRFIRIDGAVAPAISRGKRKGRPNWAKRLKETERTPYFSPEEHRAWCAAWEDRTGKCSTCPGEKVVMAGWNAKDGCRWKPCPTCGGTGLPSGKLQEKQAAEAEA